jgi:hypothetical protein
MSLSHVKPYLHRRKPHSAHRGPQRPLPQRDGRGRYRLQTPGIVALKPIEQSAIREAVESFDAFTEDNDPYGEHDFGAFRHGGHHIFWKIDYYNPDLTGGSEDPGDPSKTCRVLTIMLACEY